MLLSRRHLRCFAAVAGAIVMLVAAAAMAAAHADSAWHGIQEQRDVVRGTFTQQKYLAELDQPLVSSGHYVVAKNHGLLWQIERPVKAQIVITKKHLVQRSNGHEITRISVQQQPALGVVAAVLLAVFQADTAQLRQYFKVRKQAQHGKHWSMTLQPIAAGVSKFIEQVHLQGEAHIERIEIQQSGGDHTVIKLHADAAGRDSLSAAERAEFRR